MIQLYQALDKGPLKKSYSAKMLFIGFVGIHIPLIGILIYVSLISGEGLAPWKLIIITLILTLLATAITLYLQNNLLSPIRATAKAMKVFQERRERLPLPVHHQDEAGVLMFSVHQALDEIQRLNKDQLNFFSLLVHDLRSPLSSIMSISELISITKNNPAEITAYLDMIRECSDKGLQVIQETMDLIMNENFQLREEEMEAVELRSFLAQQLKNLEGSSSAKGISFALNVNEGDQLKVHPKLFAHIIQNLLTNAVKFSYPKGVISIEGHINDDTYQLSVTDQGLGFDQSVRDRLFDRFTSAKKKGTIGEATSGIGLYLTKNLVEKHGGSISADSLGTDQGATFKVTLPYIAMLHQPTNTTTMALSA